MGAGGALTVTLVDPDFPPAEAVMLSVSLKPPAGRVGPVNVALAKPPVVWAKGSTPPVPAVTAKFTVVPSGGGVPAVVVTFAEMVDVVPESMIEGFAETAIVLIVTGFTKSDTTFDDTGEVVLAVMFRTEVIGSRLAGITCITTVACPVLSVTFTFPLGKTMSQLELPSGRHVEAPAEVL